MHVREDARGQVWRWSKEERCIGRIQRDKAGMGRPCWMFVMAVECCAMVCSGGRRR